MTQTKPRFFVSADTSPHAKKRGFVPIGPLEMLKHFESMSMEYLYKYTDNFSSRYSYLYFLLILPLVRADRYVGL